MELLENISIGDNFYSNLTVIGVELAVILLAWLMLGWVVRFVSRRIQSSPALEKYATRAKTGIKLLRIMLLISFLALFVIAISYNGWLMAQGTDLKTWTLEKLAAIPSDFWSSLVVAMGKTLALIIAAFWLIRFVAMLLNKARVKALHWEQLVSNNEAIDAFFDRLVQIQTIAIWLLVARLTARISSLPVYFANYLWIALKVYLIISIGLLIVSAIAAIVESLNGLSKRYAETNGLLVFYDRLSGLIPLLRRCLEYMVYVAAASLVMLQLDFIAPLSRYGPGIIQGIGIIFIARVVIEVVNLLLDRNAPMGDEFTEEQKQRRETVLPLFKSIIRGAVYFVAMILVMRGVGFDPMPLLAGAGILGMVIGLGAQPLINDLVSGFFIIFENQFLVGDYIETEHAGGVVENIDLRTTRVRSPSGEQYVLRNGQIGNLVQHSRGYTNAMVEVGIDPDSDLDKVYDVIDRLGERFAKAEEQVLEATMVNNISDFSGPEVVISTATRVKPGCHCIMARKLRRLILEEFKKEGIVIPFDKRYKFA